jgi:hypothetical protein
MILWVRSIELRSGFSKLELWRPTSDQFQCRIALSFVDREEDTENLEEAGRRS